MMETLLRLPSFFHSRQTFLSDKCDVNSFDMKRTVADAQANFVVVLLWVSGIYSIVVILICGGQIRKNYARKMYISSAPKPHTHTLGNREVSREGKQLSAFSWDQGMWNGPSHSQYCNKFSQHFHMIEWVSNGTQTQIHPPQLTIVWSLTNRNYE